MENYRPIGNHEDVPLFAKIIFGSRYRGNKTPTSELEDNPEDKLPVNVIPDERESVRPNKRSKSPYFTYHKKDINTDTS